MDCLTLLACMHESVLLIDVWEGGARTAGE